MGPLELLSSSLPAICRDIYNEIRLLSMFACSMAALLLFVVVAVIRR